jgi:hypothetical protein
MKYLTCDCNCAQSQQQQHEPQASCPKCPEVSVARVETPVGVSPETFLLLLLQKESTSLQRATVVVVVVVVVVGTVHWRLFPYANVDLLTDCALCQ